MANTSPRHMPVLGNVHPIKSKNLIFRFFVDDFMSNINCGIEVMHVKHKIFFVTSFLCSLKFLLFHLIGHTKKCLQFFFENVLCLSFCDMTVPSKRNVPSL